MKKVILFLFLLLPFFAKAQTDGISYQAVIISNTDQEIPGVNISGNYLSNAEVSMRFTILHNEAIEYQETQLLSTDAYGMIHAIIGSGISSGMGSTQFQEIDWNGTPRQLFVELSYDHAGYLDFGTQELLFIPYAYHRNITATGTLIVDGETTLQSALTVANGSTSTLSGNVDIGNELNAAGATTLQSTLTVTNGNTSTLTGNVDIGGTLKVVGQTTLESALNVANGSSATITGTGEVQGNFTAGAASFLNGQVTISAALSGSDASYAAYPLRVQGSNQGIAVRVNGGRNASKNFITFFDGNNVPQGRVEGQTSSELESSFRFIWDITMAGLAQAFIAAEGIACTAQLDGFEAAVMVANTAVLGAQWIELTVNAIDNVGVAFLSGGADYAEWLERNDPSQPIFQGEVVGIKGGKISKVTKGADHIRAISTNPVVLGNMPPEGEEHKYSKVAFLGQVPVRVAGAVAEGDYILPSGHNDGIAVAMHPATVPTHRFNELVGVAWESASGPGVHVVNVAVGLTVNDLAQRVASLEQSVNTLQAQLDRIEAMLGGGDAYAEPPVEATETAEDASTSSITASSLAGIVASSPGVELSQDDFEAWLAQYGYIFEQRMETVRSVFEANGANYTQYPELALIIDQPLQALRDMHAGRFLPTVWQQFEDRVRPK